MATGKNARRATDTPPEPDNLSNLERLILVQAVFEFGNDSWPEVSKLLSGHPMLERSNQRFTPAFCNVVYLRLMQDAGLECPPPSEGRKAIVHRQLAKIHYDKRVEEVRALLLAEESKFRKIVGEIDEIRAGRWDDQIRAGIDQRPETTEAEHPQTIDAAALMEEEAAQDEAELPPADEEVDEQPPDVEPLITDAQDEIEKVDVEMESAPPQPPQSAREVSAEPPADEPMEEEDDADAEGTPSEGIQNAEEDPPAVPQTSSPSRNVSPASAAAAEEALDDVEAVEVDVNYEEAPEEDAVDEENDTQSGNEGDTQSQVGAHASDTEPQTDTTMKVEAEVEAEAEAEAELAVVSDGEQSARTDGKRKASEALSDPPRDRKRAREDSEPVDEDEPGPSISRGRRKTQGVADKKFQNVIGMLHSTISQHRYGNIFHHPIKKTEAPDYHDIVKRPMDLKTIKARVKDGLISNSLEFQRDIYLMFANAMMYNRPGSEIHNMAEEMMLESEIHINSFRQTEGFHRS